MHERNALLLHISVLVVKKCIQRRLNPTYADIVKQLKAELKRLRKQYGDSDESTMKILTEGQVYEST